MKTETKAGLIVLAIVGTVVGISGCEDNDPGNDRSSKSHDEIVDESQIKYHEIDNGTVEMNFLDSDGNKIRCFKNTGLSCFMLELSKE